MVLVLPVDAPIHAPLSILHKEPTLLNINGKKYDKSPFKTIWSYNPDYSHLKVSAIYFCFFSYLEQRDNSSGRKKDTQNLKN
jgi:hypothetical protein